MNARGNILKHTNYKKTIYVKTKAHETNDYDKIKYRRNAPLIASLRRKLPQRLVFVSAVSMRYKRLHLSFG